MWNKNTPLYRELITLHVFLGLKCWFWVKKSEICVLWWMLNVCLDERINKPSFIVQVSGLNCMCLLSPFTVFSLINHNLSLSFRRTKVSVFSYYREFLSFWSFGLKISAQMWWYITFTDNDTVSLREELKLLCCVCFKVFKWEKDEEKEKELELKSNIKNQKPNRDLSSGCNFYGFSSIWVQKYAKVSFVGEKVRLLSRSQVFFYSFSCFYSVNISW